MKLKCHVAIKVFKQFVKLSSFFGYRKISCNFYETLISEDRLVS